MSGLVGSWMVWLLVAQPAVTGAAAPAGKPAASPTVQLEEAEQRVGPLQIQNLQFTVVLHEKRIAAEPAPDPDAQTTLVAMEIVDQVGTVHYRRSFGYAVSGDEFAESMSASVQLLEGKRARGLLVTYGVLPSTPLGGQEWQVFGLFGGRLVPFGKPISLEGDLANAESAKRVVEASEEPGRQGEVLHFRVWTGNFFVVYPVLVDWRQARLSPAWRCLRMTARGPRAVCPYRILADRVPQEAGLTFVRLHAEPDDGLGTPRHVVLKPDSTVELLGSEGEMQWLEDDAGVTLLPSEDFWIRVRIDGREGWIHTQEDLAAIGLPQAG